VLRDERTAEHPAAVAEEELEERILPRRELDATAGASHLVRRGIEGQIREGERRGRRAAAAEERPHAGEELGELERLGEVVVGAQVEPEHPIGDRGPSGEQQDG